MKIIFIVVPFIYICHIAVMEMKIALGGGLLLLIIIGVIRRLAGLSTLSECLYGVCVALCIKSYNAEIRK